MIRWVASYPKSGNTWLRLLLLAYEFGEKFDPNRRPKTYRQDVDRRTHEELWPDGLDELGLADLVLLRPAALLKLAASVEGPICLKTHSANVTIDGIPQIPVTLTDFAVYMVRDPRDVAVSFADHMGISIDEAIDRMGEDDRWLFSPGRAQFLSTWSGNVNSWLKAEFPVFTLRYEDLHADTAGHFRKLLEWAGAKVIEDRLSYAVERTAFDRLRADEEANGYSTKSELHQRFFRVGRPGQWQQALTDKHVNRIEQAHGEAMKACRYL